MKKTLLLSVVASTLIFAGGDIAPVESAVVTPAPVQVVDSGWKFSGQGVFYYETNDAWGFNDVFDQESSRANAGIQLTATNDNLIGGVGFGVQLNGIGTLGLDEDVVSSIMQSANGDLNGGYISQLYLTYGINNTSFKVGRQELPKSLSPFAYSEDWNVFKNTFNAALVVNTDIPNTTLVGAWVRDANHNHYGSNMGDFYKLNGDDGVWMLTAQNKSIDNLILTGSFYYANNWANILWLDAQYNAGIVNIGIQGGSIMPDSGDDTNAFGAKIGTKLFDIVNTSLAYSYINDSTNGIFNVGGNGSVLYTDMLSDEQYPFQRRYNNKFVIRADADVLGGNLGAAYSYEDAKYGFNETVKEFNLCYSTKIANNIDVSATYGYLEPNSMSPDTLNTIRLIGRYNF